MAVQGIWSLKLIVSRMPGAKFVEHNLAMKRQGGARVEEGKRGREEEGTVFTEEDFARLEKDLFLHSKPIKARGED